MGLATKPSTYLNWTDGDPLKVTQPPSPQQLSGWTEGEPIPFQYLNWLFYETDQWIQWLDGITNESQVNVENLGNARLINGGSWSWNLTTTTLAWASSFNIAIPSVADSDNQVAAGNATLSDGQVAYVAANIPFTTTGNTTNLSNQLTNLAYVLGLVIGQTVTGAGIPGGTTITAINTGANSATMSANATATASGVNLTFSGTAALSVAVATSSSFVPSVNTLVIARRVGSVVFIGVNSAQMVLRDGEAKLLSTVGFGLIDGAVVSLTAGASLTQNQAAYISQGASDGSRTLGSAYPTDASGTLGIGRGIFAGFVMTAAASSAAVSLVSNGLMGGFTGLTPGAQYWLDPLTVGGITATEPTLPGQAATPVGLAASTTQLYVLAQAQKGASLARAFLATSGAVITITTPQPVYISPGTGVDSGRTVGTIYPCDTGVTNGSVRSAFIGFLVATTTLGGTGWVAQAGVLSGFTGLTAGAVYYADPASPGGITATKPTTSNQYLVPVGMAISTTQLAINAALFTDGGVITAPVGTGVGAGGILSLNNSNSTYSITSSNNGQTFNVDVTATPGPVLFQLPNPSGNSNLKFTIVDVSGYFGTYPCKLLPFSTEKIQNFAGTFIMNASFGRWTFETDGTNWSLAV
jgi:hypothetical protein